MPRGGRGRRGRGGGRRGGRGGGGGGGEEDGRRPPIPAAALRANEDEDEEEDEDVLEAVRRSLAEAHSQSILLKEEDEAMNRAIQESLKDSGAAGGSGGGVGVPQQLPQPQLAGTSTSPAPSDEDDEFSAMIDVSSLSDRLGASTSNGSVVLLENNSVMLVSDEDDDDDEDVQPDSTRGRKRKLASTSIVSISSGEEEQQEENDEEMEEEEGVSSSRDLGRRKKKKAVNRPQDSDSSSDEIGDDDNDEDYFPVASSSTNGTTLGTRMTGSSEQSGSANAITSKEVLNNDQVVTRMRTMFESSLALHETGQYMKACQAIATTLYPHQMYALAWMTARENKKGLGVRGGILADDMGLGKTLTMIAIIFTNLHDGRPLARPQHGFQRRLSKAVLRYLPQKCGGGPRVVDGHDNVAAVAQEQQDLKAVGTKCKRPNNAINLIALFGNDPSDADERVSSKSSGIRRKDNKQMVKSAKFRAMLSSESKSGATSAIDKELATLDESLLSEEEADDFDSMIDSGGLSQKLGIGTNSELLLKRPEKFHFNDGLSSDEEYAAMTEQERNEKMKPNANLNVDGASLTLSDEDDETGQPSSTTKERKRTWSSDDEDLPDLEEPPRAESVPEISLPATPQGSNREAPTTVPELTPNQKKNLIVPPRETAICGNRRRATLIVTPASLITHWIQQLQEHVDIRVEIKLFVHYGATKAVVKSELQDQDIVLTTYGTLSAEFNAQGHSPLLGTKWLRVCLDEGHFIKNHRTRASKAASNLDTQRKWIISGTPIQNNLGELWSLLGFLELEPYAGNRALFKKHIEYPIKHGHPNGIKRLQTVMEAICLRRTKSDTVNGKPIVSLPTKTVTVKELEFTEEERAVYNAYHSDAREQILRYVRRGTLLRNYAHVFAVMMRLRQLCCHRELLPVQWQSVDLDCLIAMAAEEAAKASAAAAAVGGIGGADDDEARNKRMAEQLRDMIRDGMSDECSICLSEFNGPVITPCGHLYCRQCITIYIEGARPPPARCPLCRGALSAKQLLEAARDEESEEGEGKSDPFEDIVVNVSSTKINAVLKELRGTKRDFPAEKTIVVSQFTSLLSIIQRLLTEEGYSWTRLDGSMTTRERSSVIADFQDPAPGSPKILLLSLRAGGVGLNLTAASRMLLLDPAWNPSTEEQCFDRIHRLGQVKNVTVTKFVIKDSIEQQMLAIQEKKRNLISGAFRQSDEERREQRIQDIRAIFGI